MLKPEHVTASELASQRRSTRRTISIAAVGALHIVLIWALASGLASNMVAHITEDVKVAVIKEKVEVAKPPPPPPPDFKVPPPDFVPPPEINIQTEMAPTNAITQVQKQAPAPAAPPPPAPPKPVSTEVVPPKPVGKHDCNSKYPPMARKLQHDGSVKLSFTAKADGTTTGATLVESSGHSELDDAALSCANDWRWKPPTQGGNPIDKTYTVTVKYNLQ